MRKIALLFFLLLFLIPVPVLARLGVGIGTGKIEVQDILKPGIIYSLPPFAVLNTGDQPSDYAVLVAYHQNQPELRPAREWFTFDPPQFHLEPGKVQMVQTKLYLPIKTPPGKYFAYVEGHPVQKGNSGDTVVGIAAASKLYFTVAPANLILGVYYRVLSYWKAYQPWSNRVLGLLALIIIAIVFRRFFKIEIKGTVKSERDKEKAENNKQSK